MSENEDDGPITLFPENEPRPRISIVIPIYNEQAILRAAVNDLRETFHHWVRTLANAPVCSRVPRP